MPSKHLERALHLMKKRPELAAKELRLAIAEDPDDGHLHGLLAACALDSGDKTVALEESRLCIGCDPKEPLGFQMLAHYYFQEGNLLEAEVAIEEAMELDPYNPSYWGLLANIEIQNNELQRALEAAESGLRIDPSHVHCHNLRALILTRLGKSASAQESMDTAMSANPEDALTHAYRGWTLLEKHQHEESRQHFREALRLDPMLEWARQGLIKALQMRNWAYTWHRKLKTKWTFVACFLWLLFNIHLIGVCHNAGPDWQTAWTILSFLSWTSFIGFTSFVFLPYGLVAEPILRFGMQFDADGKWVLTEDEQRFNKHAIAFLLAALLAVVLGIVTTTWWPVAAVAALYVATLPIGYPLECRRKWTVWAAHIGGAVVVAFCVVAVAKGHGSGTIAGIAALNAAKYAAFPSLLKAGAGVSIFKVFGSAGAIKGLAAMFGLGGAGALQALKEKEKQKVREKMMGDLNKPAKKK
jgi:Tfp pilus assembly protein PilF